MYAYDVFIARECRWSLRVSRCVVFRFVYVDGVSFGSRWGTIAPGAVLGQTPPWWSYQMTPTWLASAFAFAADANISCSFAMASCKPLAQTGLAVARRAFFASSARCAVSSSLKVDQAWGIFSWASLWSCRVFVCVCVRVSVRVDGELMISMWVFVYNTRTHIHIDKTNAWQDIPNPLVAMFPHTRPYIYNIYVYIYTYKLKILNGHQQQQTNI